MIQRGADAGRYLLLCTTVEGEGPHYNLGMSYAFVIE